MRGEAMGREGLRLEMRNEKLAIRNLRSVEVCAVGRDALIPP